MEYVFMKVFLMQCYAGYSTAVTSFILGGKLAEIARKNSRT